MINFTEFFGTDDFDILQEKQKAEGYISGTQLAERVHEMIISEFGMRSRTYREAMLNALREQL